MARFVAVLGTAVAAAAVMAPRAALGQTADHVHDDGHAHSHAGAPVDCQTLATPPWLGLPELDREKIAALQQAVAHLNTPEKARAAGYNPALGDIPGMGVHYVNSEFTRNGVRVDQPDHLLFTTIDGQETLVGAAYAFHDVVNTNVPIPFESDLAAWHDHPQFAPPGQTLHMLHVWFIPSSNGPFAGLNFWLPFQNLGIQPPNPCWMANEEDAQRIQRVSFALVPMPAERAIRLTAAEQAERERLIRALDDAAFADDHHAWVAAADAFLAHLRPAERLALEARLQTLTMAQMSSEQREALEAQSGTNP